MKKFTKLSILVGILLLAGSAMAQITGSAHDFSGNGWAQNQICITCHTPHNADTSVANAPLWNHEVTTATYTLYTSNTLDATLGQPNGVSKLCLSCHDGTVALDSFGGTTGSTMISGNANLGTDLSDDHPISFDYTAVAATDSGIYAETTAVTGITGVSTISDLLSGNNMECSSCHDVHNKYGNANLLVKANTGSQLCLTCHNK
jgi:predicted CXXCH cytochrome family protein